MAPVVSSVLLLAAHPNTAFCAGDVPAIGIHVLEQGLNIEGDPELVVWLQLDLPEVDPWAQLGRQIGARRIPGEPVSVPGL